MSVGWNPWHGCTKISPGCKYCYMYRSDERHGRNPAAVLKTTDFNIPIRKKRDGSYKVHSSQLVWTCLTSDFFHPDADKWRAEAWDMMNARKDLYFFLITKRIDRFANCIPSNWGDGWDNVEIACTVENQDRADFRLPIYADVPIKHKTIICEPILEQINVKKWLSLRRKDEESRPVRIFNQLVVGGESGLQARVCKFEWVLNLRQQCLETGTAFSFRQTGAHFEKDGHIYNIPHKLQLAQARKAYLSLKGDPYTETDANSNGLTSWKRYSFLKAKDIKNVSTNILVNQDQSGQLFLTDLL